jgi:hypothetical protein
VQRGAGGGAVHLVEDGDPERAGTAKADVISVGYAEGGSNLFVMVSNDAGMTPRRSGDETAGRSHGRGRW